MILALKSLYWTQEIFNLVPNGGKNLFRFKHILIYSNIVEILKIVKLSQFDFRHFQKLRYISDVSSSDSCPVYARFI